jgi:subtilisin-like proprotein convertase family protein
MKPISPVILRNPSRVGTWMVLALMVSGAALAGGSPALADDREVLGRGAESYGPVTPHVTAPMRQVGEATPWFPGDPVREIPRRFYPPPGGEPEPYGEGHLDPLADLQAAFSRRAPSITLGVNINGQGFTGAVPPDTVGDVGPNHYVQAVNASRIAVYDKNGVLQPGFPIDLDSLAPVGHACRNGGGDPIVLYDWLADRWFLQEFTGGGVLCLYVSTSPDPTGTYYFYAFTPPSFPDYPHYGVWPDAYYCATNEGSGNRTTYAFDRLKMLAGLPATMQRLTVVPRLTGYGFQALTPADLDGYTPPPAGAPGIFMRHFDGEAHGSPDPATDLLHMYEMSVDWANPGNTTVTTLPAVTITDYNSWMINYSTFYSVPQPGVATRLDPIREAILNRLVYRNFGSHEAIVGNFPTNRNPATSGGAVELGTRWFELRRVGGPGNPWVLHQEGTFGGDTNSPDANFFLGAIAMDGAGNIGLGYNKTDISAVAPVFPSIGYTGRLETDPPGTLAAENIAVFGVQSSTQGGGRWGDYAAMSVDPADDCTFWLTGEYMPGASWGTRITSFVFQECLFGFVLAPTPAERNVCAATDPDPTFDIAVTAVGGWSESVTLTAADEPPGASSSFVPNAAPVDFTSVYTLTGLASSVTGSYPITITGTGSDVPETVRSTQVLLNLAIAEPGVPALIGPADGATGVSLLPQLSWAAAGEATAYHLEVATDAGFGNIVYSASGLVGTTHVLASSLDPSTLYYWRVTAINVCGSVASAVASFTTVLLECSTFASTNVPLPIPPSGTSGTTTSTLTIEMDDGGIIADVNVLGLVGTHTWMFDLHFDLTSPGATTVRLMDRSCGSTDNFNLNLDDEAPPGNWPCPPTDGGTYRPSSPLAAFDGGDSTGTWTLTIVDNATGDVGQLQGWGLEICIEVPQLDPLIFADGFESGGTSEWSVVAP